VHDCTRSYHRISNVPLKEQVYKRRRYLTHGARCHVYLVVLRGYFLEIWRGGRLAFVFCEV
jgi:hypothetical protein